MKMTDYCSSCSGGSCGSYSSGAPKPEFNPQENYAVGRVKEERTEVNFNTTYQENPMKDEEDSVQVNYMAERKSDEDDGGLSYSIGSIQDKEEEKEKNELETSITKQEPEKKKRDLPLPVNKEKSQKPMEKILSTTSNRGLGITEKKKKPWEREW